MRTRGWLDGDVALRWLRRVRSSRGQATQERQRAVPQWYRDAFCLGGVHCGGFLPLLGRSPHGGLRPRQAKLLTRPLDAEAHERWGRDPPCWGGPRAVGALRFRHGRQLRSTVAWHRRLAAVQGDARCPVRNALERRAAPYRLHLPRRSSPVAGAMLHMSESAAALGRSPRSGPLRSGSGAGSADRSNGG